LAINAKLQRQTVQLKKMNSKTRFKTCFNQQKTGSLIIREPVCAKMERSKVNKQRQKAKIKKSSIEVQNR
jgi:hypothetical protein